MVAVTDGHHTTLPGPWSVTSASASSLQTSYCALLHFPSIYAINIPISTASLRSFENLGIFKIQNFENFLLPFLGALATHFRSSTLLPQDLPYLSLQRHPYATLKKYPRKSRKHKTGYTSRITSSAVCTGAQ